MSETYTLHTDGGARGNPGPSAIGGELKDSKEELIEQFSEFIGITTNNVAEYKGLIKGLKIAIENDVKHIQCILDSELVVKQLNGEYKVKNPNMKTLYDKVIEIKANFETITFSHVRREENKVADKLVNEALDSMF